MNIIVIDNFYENPELVRTLALNAKYQDVTQLNYPGFQSNYNYAAVSVTRKIEKAISCKVAVNPNSQTFGKFRVMLKETGSALKVHLDGQSDWTGVLYLNPTESCRGGTGFYTHIKTGFDGPTKDMGWREIEKEIIAPDTLKNEAWAQTGFVAMKFNRLVLFRGN